MSEGNIIYFAKGNEIYDSSGSESRACIEDKMVNVGDPLSSPRREYRSTSVTVRRLGWDKGSQMDS